MTPLLANLKESMMLNRHKLFRKMDTLFKAALLGVLGENIVDAYASIDNGKDM